jgi:hypothetical protein
LPFSQGNSLSPDKTKIMTFFLMQMEHCHFRILGKVLLIKTFRQQGFLAAHWPRLIKLQHFASQQVLPQTGPAIRSSTSTKAFEMTIGRLRSHSLQLDEIEWLDSREDADAPDAAEIRYQFRYEHIWWHWGKSDEMAHSVLNIWSQHGPWTWLLSVNVLATTSFQADPTWQFQPHRLRRHMNK